MRHQVAGEEHREQDLGELAGLERQRPDADPDPGAVDVPAQPGQQRQQQQRETGDHRGVRVALQHPVVAHEERTATADATPTRVHTSCRAAIAAAAAVLGQVEPVDHHQPEPVEQRWRSAASPGRRTGPASAAPGAPRADQHDQPDAVRDHPRRQLAVDRQAHDGVGHQHDADGEARAAPARRRAGCAGRPW